MAITAVARLMVDQTFAGAVRCQNVFHFATEQDPPGPVLDLASHFANHFINEIPNPGVWRNNVHSFLHFNTLFYSTLIGVLTDTGSIGLGGVAGVAGLTWTCTGAVNFTFGSPPVPAPCAGITTWRTGQAGRSHRGRTYWAGIPYGGPISPEATVAPQADVSFAGQLRILGGRQALDNIGAGLMARYHRITGSFASEWWLCLVSTKLAGKVPPINPAGVFPITDYSVPNYWATMGSRRGGRGI